MAFERPSLSELIARAEADFATRIEGADTQYSRGNLAVLARAHAGTAHGLYAFLDYMARQSMPDTAELEFLGRHASIWGITRKPATKAQGQIIIQGNDGTVIPAGVKLRRSDNARYTVLVDAEITSGQAAVNAEAEDAGAGGNLAANAPMAFISPVIGAASVGKVGPDGISGGADAETDASLKSRLLQRIKEQPHGGASHDYVTWAKECTGITRAFAYPEALGPGTVTVAILTDNSPTGPIPAQADVDTVQAYINERRPVTAAVTVFAPVADPLNFTIQLSPDSAEIRAAVEAELKDLIAREAEPAGTLLISHVREAISIAAGENDHVLTAPAANTSAAAGHIVTMGTITWE